MSKSTISCLIAGFNESTRVNAVLSVVSKMDIFENIYFVNDGSTDNTEGAVQEYSSRVSLISLPKNVGKSEAISSGLQNINSTYVLLLDADLKNVLRDELENAIKRTLEMRADLIIFRKKNNLLTLRGTRMDIILAGSMIIKRELLAEILKTHPARYELEVMRNQYVLHHKRAAFWCFFSADHYYKTEKRGLFLGLTGEMEMYYGILRRIGILNLVRQIAFFCRQELQN